MDNPLHILTSVQKPDPLAESNFSHDIKRKPLQPRGHVANFGRGTIQLIDTVEKHTNGGIDVGLKLHQIRHGVNVGNGLAHGPVRGFVLRVEDARDDFAVDEGAEDAVEVGLFCFKTFGQLTSIDSFRGWGVKKLTLSIFAPVP